MVYFPRRAYRPVEYPLYHCPFRCRGLARSVAGFGSLPVPDAARSIPIRPASTGPTGLSGPGTGPRPGTSGSCATWQEYPRAWVVHDAREAIPVDRAVRGRRGKTMQEILYAPDPVWHDASQPVYDPRSLAWVAPDDLAAIGPTSRARRPGRPRRSR